MTVPALPDATEASTALAVRQSDIRPPDVWTRHIHPAARVFPMLPRDELAELAEDIRVNGLRNPIIVDGKGRVIDGRNRLSACGIAGVAPRFETFDGDVPAFVLSANVARRHLTVGQRAMAVAMLFPDPAKLKRIGCSFAAKNQTSAAALSKARTILSYAKPLAESVLAGCESLDGAYHTARGRLPRSPLPKRAAASRTVSTTTEEEEIVDAQAVEVSSNAEVSPPITSAVPAISRALEALRLVEELAAFCLAHEAPVIAGAPIDPEHRSRLLAGIDQIVKWGQDALDFATGPEAAEVEAEPSRNASEALQRRRMLRAEAATKGTGRARDEDEDGGGV